MNVNSNTSFLGTGIPRQIKRICVKIRNPRTKLWTYFCFYIIPTLTTDALLNRVEKARQSTYMEQIKESFFSKSCNLSIDPERLPNKAIKISQKFRLNFELKNWRFSGEKWFKLRWAFLSSIYETILKWTIIYHWNHRVDI